MLVDPHFRPNYSDPLDYEDWFAKQAFGYMMLDQRVLTNTGRRIVQKYRYSGDAQSVFRELALEAQTSTQAALSASDILGKMTSIRYDGRSSKTAITFITDFEAMIDRYNEQQTDDDMRLTGLFMKTLLQNAVSEISMLLDVSNQDKQAMARGANALSFSEYLHLLKSAAALYDRRKLGRPSRGSIHHMEGTPTSDDQDVTDEITTFLVNEMRRRVPGSTMNKTTWESLSKEGRSVWDTLSDGDKRKILQYAHSRAERPTLQANQHDTTPADEVDNSNANDDATNTPANTETVPTTAEINNVVTKARSEAHPGDPRRMMGTTGSTPKKNRKADVKFVNWEISDGDGYQSSDDDLVDGYWESDHEDDQDFHRGD